MSPPAARVGWLAPMLVGASAAIAGEVAMAILLYTGPGFVRSLTTVLAVEAAALGGGLWTTARSSADLVERLRRRWLFCLLSFVAAAVFGTWWSLGSESGAGRLEQGLGLAVLAALPMYACGAVLGGMGALAASRPAPSRARAPGAPATIGAGLGFVITGALLPRAPIPASLLVGCLVLLSAGGMIYGVVLSAWPQTVVRASRPAGTGEVRVEDRKAHVDDAGARYLLEGGHVRRRTSLDGASPLPWDLAVARSFMPPPDAPWRVLALGGGASGLPLVLVEEHPTVTVDVLERTPAVVELAREHFDAHVPPTVAGRLCVKIGNLEDLLAELHGTYDLVLVDTAALAPLGGVGALSRAGRLALLAAADPERGVIAWGPQPPAASETGVEARWSQVRLARGGEGAAEAVLLLRAPASPAPARPVVGFAPAGGGAADAASGGEAPDASAGGEAPDGAGGTTAGGVLLS